MPYKIVIIGAGIAGLVAGILLRQQGHDVKIYEKRSKIQPIGGGLGIWPNGVQVLMNLPCANKISQLPATITTDHFADANGNTLMEVSRDIFLQINGHPIMNVCRSELHQILLDEFGSQHINFETKCVAIEQSEHQAIAHFNNDEMTNADIIIGADGAYSTVRKVLFPEKNLIYSGYLHFLGVSKHASHKNVSPNFIYGKNRYCLQFPIANHRRIFYLVKPYAQGLINQSTMRQQRIDLFRGWAKEVDTLLDDYETSLHYPEFNQHFYCEEAYAMPLFSSWHHHRVVLIGDAAHPMGSVLGLGVGLALEDSYQLSSCLSNYNNLEEAISTYETTQIPRAAIFYQLEKEASDFILHADEEKYNNFIIEFKNKSAIEVNQSLINHLKC